MPEPEPEPAPAPAPEPELSTARLFASTVLALVLLTAAVAALGAWLHDPLVRVGTTFVHHLGGPGVAVGFAVPDAFTVPVPNDTFLALAHAGGMPFWSIVGWATLGSLVGGSTGWALGRGLRRTRWLTGFFRGRGAGLDRALRRRGAVVVAIAAVTPLPYSVSAWAAGSTEMPLSVFLAVSSLRVFRVAGALWLVQLGLLAAG